MYHQASFKKTMLSLGTSKNIVVLNNEVIKNYINPMKKIGRNDPCPCGSGSKFKHCCWKKGITFRPQVKQRQHRKTFSIGEYFKQFYTLDLTATLAALSIVPENHGKNLRLDYLTLESLASNYEAEKIINPSQLKKVLDTHFPYYGMEDPPENMFTENVISPTGNNTVYGGNFEQGVFTLNQLIKVTNYYRDSIPEELRAILVPAQHLLLLLSDLIAHRVGHSKNLAGEYGESSEITFPENLQEYKSALWFDRSWLTKYCKDLNVDLSVLEHFIIRHEDVKGSSIDIENIGENPLLVKPLLELPDGILVVSPTNIVGALVHFILVQVDRFGCMKEFIRMFHRLVWDELMFNLRNLGFEGVQYEFPRNESLPVKPALFKFDEDKYALLTFSYDKGEDYNPLTPCHADTSAHGHGTNEFNKALAKGIKESYPEAELLQMNVYSSIGREYMLFGAYEEGEYGFVTTAYKLISLLKSEAHDRMSLWYFERAKERFTKLVRIFPMSSFLDLFSFYKSTDSFYLNDEALPTDLVITPGEGFHIVKKAVVREDPLVAYYSTEEIPHPILLPVIKADEYILRYASREKELTYLEFFLPNFPFDMWVRSGKRRDEMEVEERSIYWEFNETICYWLMQARSDLAEHLKPLSLVVMTLTYDFDEHAFFEDMSFLGSKEPTVQDSFTLKVDKDSIQIQIPRRLDTFISAPDNEGERILLSKLLEAFGLVLEFHGLTNTLDQKTRKTIVDEVAPLGLKKMLLLIHTGKDLATDPRYLAEARYLQEANRQLFMDEVVPELGEKCPPVGDIPGKEDKLKLTKNIVLRVQLSKLKDILSEYNSHDLLKKLMALNDRLLHENALMKMRTPTRVHCFRDQEDTVQKIMEQAKLADETTLSIRCLIEHLAAEPTFGTKVISTQTIDDLIALMSLIIFWGGVGDQINHDLFDVRLGVLPSGRIGTNSHEITDEFFDQLSTVRAKEFIEETTESFPSKFTEEGTPKKSIPGGLDEAFAEEIGISIPKLGGIVKFFALLGMEQAVPVPSLSLKDVEKKIQNNFEEPITKEEVDAALNFLCLKNRGGIQKLPKEGGFENTDISPWRFNRRLSYLQRPLILVDYGTDEHDPKVYWTPRHMNLSWRFLVNLFLSGRFKAPKKSKLESKVGKIAQERRAELQREAFAWFRDQITGIVEQEVGIGPKERLKNDKLIGDVDILVIDSSLKILLSVECKRTEAARNSKEMIEEVDKYLDPNDGYIKKHQRRHAWLEKNKGTISKEFGVDVSDFSLHSFFVTNEALSVQFLKKRELPMPIISMFDLRSHSHGKIVEMVS